MCRLFPPASRSSINSCKFTCFSPDCGHFGSDGLKSLHFMQAFTPMLAHQATKPALLQVFTSAPPRTSSNSHFGNVYRRIFKMSDRGIEVALLGKENRNSLSCFSELKLSLAI